ncbi:MAG: hypothetical protein R3C10_14425 [Pirellulales bacterium]
MRAGRDCVGLATFDLDPGDLRFCAVQMPAGWRVDRITVDGVPASWLATSEGRFRIELGQRAEPLRLAVYYRRDAAVADSVDRLVAAPTLLDVPMPEMLWTISAEGPIEARRAVASDDDTPLSPLQMATRRYRGLVNVAERYLAASRQQPREEVIEAVRPWCLRVAAARDEVSRCRSDELDIVRRSAVDETVRGIDERWTNAVAELPRDAMVAAGILGDPTSTSAGEAAQLWQTTVTDLAFSQHLATAPGIEGLAVKDLQRDGGLPGRAIAAVACFGLAVLLVRHRRAVALLEVSVAWLYVFGIVAGAVWWIGLEPSFVGPVILAWSALSLLFWWRGSATAAATEAPTSASASQPV